MSNPQNEKHQSSGSELRSADSVAEHARRRSWVLRHKLLTFAAAFLLVALVHYLVVRPKDNPQPQKKLLVQGNFPYHKGWELRIEASYYSNNPTCRQTARAFFIFPQADVTRETWRMIPVVRDGDSRYRFEFYEDAVLPGVCDWRLQFLFYRIYNLGKRIQGGAILGLPGRFNVIHYTCSNTTSTYFKSPDRTPVTETGVTCYEGDNHWKDTARTDHLIDFVWEEKQK